MFTHIAVSKKIDLIINNNLDQFKPKKQLVIIIKFCLEGFISDLIINTITGRKIINGLLSPVLLMASIANIAITSRNRYIHEQF